MGARRSGAYRIPSLRRSHAATDLHAPRRAPVTPAELAGALDPLRRMTGVSGGTTVPALPGALRAEGSPDKTSSSEGRERLRSGPWRGPCSRSPNEARTEDEANEQREDE